MAKISKSGDAPFNYFRESDPFRIPGSSGVSAGQAPLTANTHAFLLDQLTWLINTYADGLEKHWNHHWNDGEKEQELLGNILSTQQDVLSMQKDILAELKELNNNLKS